MKTDFTPEEFDRSVPHPVQSYAWGEFRKANGSTVERFVIDGKGFTVTFHRVPLTGKTIGILTQCHLPNALVIEQLKKLGAKHKTIFIKTEPYVFYEVTQPESLEKTRTSLQKLGLTKGKDLYPAFSFVIDLTQSEEALLSAMKSKTRYNINLAGKKGLTVRVSTDDSDFGAYLELLAETTKRQAFYAHTKTYQQAMWKHMKKAGIASVITARYAKEALASFILFSFGGRLYYPYGASTRNHRELMAPQLTMWEAIRYGKKMGFSEFEMWGSLGEAYEPTHSWTGFHRFKAGFGGKHVVYVTAYDLILSPLWYGLYQFAETLRWTWLKLASKKA
jgi:lipid II:glycine glycyltransferase (peptidoglycan interpeptide bridge formation enzyme)